MVGMGEEWVRNARGLSKECARNELEMGEEWVRNGRGMGEECVRNG